MFVRGVFEAVLPDKPQSSEEIFSLKIEQVNEILKGIKSAREHVNSDKYLQVSFKQTDHC